MIYSRTKLNPVSARWPLLLGIVLLWWTTARGQTPTPEVVPADDILSANDDHHTFATRLRVITDPTVIARRVWLETEWDKYEGDTHGVEETLGAVWGWRVSTNQDWAVRLKLPYEWRMTGGPGSAVDKDGFGDLKLATGTALRLSRSWRTAAGLELRMPTAADGLGGRDWRLQEFAAIAWDLTRSLSLSPSFEYNQSIAEVDNAHPQNYLELFFPATFVLPHHWSVTPRYEAKVDFERENRVIQSVRLQVAKQLSHPPIGFMLAIKKPFYADALDPGRKEFQLNFMVTYFFR